MKPSTSFTYTLHVTTASCSDSATIHIKIIPAITATVTAVNDTICPFGTATLTATGAGGQVTYKWSTGATTSTIRVNPAATTTYTAMVYGICDSVPESITVTVLPIPTAVISGTAAKCKGKKDTLTASGGTTYLWSNGSTGATYYTGDINSDSTITLIAYNALGCSDTTHFKITVTPTPTVSITYTPNCANNPVVIHASATGTGPFIYIWSPGGQTTDSITVIDSASTTYTLLVSNGCPITKQVTVVPSTIPMTACCSTTIAEGTDTVIEAGGVKSYLWTPSTGLNCDTCSTVIASPTVTTTYTVTGTDANGCQTERIITIVVETPCFSFAVPNVFTPNYAGAGGVNNLFYIKTANLNSWSIFIYDRWGKEMFKTTNPDVFWNGETEGGGIAPDGVYYYIITASCQNNSYTKDGFLQLIR